MMEALRVFITHKLILVTLGLFLEKPIVLNTKKIFVGDLNYFAHASPHRLSLLNIGNLTPQTNGSVTNFGLHNLWN